MTKLKGKKWLIIVAAILVVIFCVGSSAIWQTKHYPQKEGLPSIGIAWCNYPQDYSWEAKIIEEAGGNVVELNKISAPGLTYNHFGKLDKKWVESSGALSLEAADIVKTTDYSDTNSETVLKGIDAVIFFGGYDISPSLYKNPQEVANNGEGFNPTRDVSDYILMSYCIKNDIPILCICRGMQMLCIVSGCDVVQDLADYYNSLGLPYNDYHRITDATEWEFAHHDISITTQDSLMYDIVGANSLANVSSWHHQGIVTTENTNLTTTATAECGGVNLVEAVELQKNTFCLGVQFHPEIDCGKVINEGVSKEDVCDYDTCLNFFKTLVEYASKKGN